MTNITGLKILFGLIISCVDFAACCIPLFLHYWVAKPRNIALITCTTGGILLSISLLQLLNESEKTPSLDPDGGADKGFPVIHLIAGVGFIATMIMEWSINAHRERKKENQIKESVSTEMVDMVIVDHQTASNNNAGAVNTLTTTPFNQTWRAFIGSRPFIVLLCLSCDSLLTGITLGVQKRVTTIVSLMIAVISHDWVEAVALSITFIKYQKVPITDLMHSSISVSTIKNIERMHRRRVLLAGLVFCACTPLGVLIGILLKMCMSEHNVYRFASAMLAYTSGAFLYIATIQIISKEFQETETEEHQQTPQPLRWEVIDKPENFNAQAKSDSIIEKTSCVILGFSASTLLEYIMSIYS
jgi:zinc transporter ZupT